MGPFTAGSLVGSSQIVTNVTNVLGVHDILFKLRAPPQLTRERNAFLVFIDEEFAQRAVEDWNGPRREQRATGDWKNIAGTVQVQNQSSHMLRF